MNLLELGQLEEAFEELRDLAENAVDYIHNLDIVQKDDEYADIVAGINKLLDDLTDSLKNCEKLAENNN